MIWFQCQECGKKHGRPESSAGALTFCTCGHGNTVPWESQAEPDPVVVVDDLPTSPLLAPMKFELEAQPLPPPGQRPAAEKPRRRGESRPPRTKPSDPTICLHHQGRASQATCVDCSQGFCEDCLVYVEAKPLCGPCKNRRVKALHLPPPNSQLALVCLLLALVTGPLAFCLYPMGLNFQTQRLTLFALMPQLSALALGILALRKLRENRKQGGQALALTGILAATFGAFWTVFLALYASRLWV